jgi:hypothetical protein
MEHWNIFVLFQKQRNFKHLNPLPLNASRPSPNVQTQFSIMNQILSWAKSNIKINNVALKEHIIQLTDDVI